MKRKLKTRTTYFVARAGGGCAREKAPADMNLHVIIRGMLISVTASRPNQANLIGRACDARDREIGRLWRGSPSSVFARLPQQPSCTQRRSALSHPPPSLFYGTRSALCQIPIHRHRRWPQDRPSPGCLLKGRRVSGRLQLWRLSPS